MRGGLRAGASRCVFVLAVILVLSTSLASPAGGQPEGGPVDLGTFDAPLRFVAAEASVLDVTGELDGRPDGGSYPETIEIRPASTGALTVVNDVSLRAYVEGVAEVPVRWPIEALKAQAVAARTYAWYSQGLGSFESRGYDICATVSCQVYAGREHVSEPGGQRWQRAVANTADEVLVHDGEPILARYFSTSGGHTRANEDVYPDEGPRPYLKGVPDPEDVISPLHEWSVTFSREAMNAILAEGERLAATVPFETIEHLAAEAGRADQVRVVSRTGTEVIVGASAFRSFVSGVAPDLYPGRYPSRSAGLRLPLTLPSSRFEVTVSEDRVVIDGRGFGHGVGMSQYGALGKAVAGMSYEDILAAYYQGVRPRVVPDAPQRVRVGLAADTGRITLRPRAPARILAGERVLSERGMGRWTVVPGSGGTLRLIAPPGYGAPLVVSPTTVSDAAPSEVEVIELEAVVNKPAELFLTIESPAGEVVADRSLGAFEGGRRSLSWDLDVQGDQLPSGIYEVSLSAIDEVGDRAGEPARVAIRPVAARDGAIPGMLGEAPLPDRGDPWALLMAAVAGVLVGTTVGHRAGRRRWSE